MLLGSELVVSHSETDCSSDASRSFCFRSARLVRCETQRAVASLAVIYDKAAPALRLGVAEEPFWNFGES